MRVAASAVLAGAVALGAAACGGGSSSGSSSANPGPVQHPTSLVAETGKNDGFGISVKDNTGATIRNLAAGTYQLVVHDYSDFHNFRLRGTGVDDATSVGDKTTQTFTVTFSPGTYTFLCDPHASEMHGSFKVS